MTEMTAEIAKLLREPFAAEHVGKLPRVWCKACRDEKFKVCQQHRKVKCRDCGNNITDAHLHLDYVGHAEITDRLLHADPEWTWEPVALGPDGLPLLDRAGGLWIRLTVAGVTRLGYGHADGKTGPDAVKEAIGDALRNAAMRFGVALDLWGAKFKDGAEEESEQSQPDPDQVRQILANARKAIDTCALVDALPAITQRAREYAERGVITDADLAGLEQRIQARRDLLAVEDRTAEPVLPETAYGEVQTVGVVALPGEQQPMDAEWPPPARPGDPA